MNVFPFSSLTLLHGAREPGARETPGSRARRRPWGRQLQKGQLLMFKFPLNPLYQSIVLPP